jgi:3alpha(or 20beta)-hydroxysteroid dehydrogenase
MPRSFDIAGRTAFVTGAASGIGCAVVERLAEEGVRVVVADINEKEAVRLAAEHDGLGVGLDVTSEGAWGAAVEAVRAAYGEIDFLVNSAGIVKMSPIQSLTLEDYQRQITVNQVGTFLGMKAGIALFGMREAAIVNISSINALRGSPDSTAYAASKAAVLSMTKSAARDLAPRVRVNAVQPGIIDTPMQNNNSPTVQAIIDRAIRTPGRMGDPREIANVVLFFLSGLSSYVTGATLVVDGGVTLGSAS